MQVLIIKTSSMGDIIHTLPSLTDAYHALQDIHFDWVIEESFSQIPTWHKSVHKVIPITTRYWSNINAWKKYCKFIYTLQQNHYDAIIDAQGLIKISVLITNIARGKKHGMNWKSSREPIASWFYHKKYEINKKQHAIERIRQLFAISLKYQLFPHSINYDIAHNFTPKINHVPYLIFLHSTSRIDKCWPESYWRFLVKNAINYGYHVKLPWGTKQEKLRSQRIIQGLNQTEILPFLSLTELGNQIAGATAIISVDTGLSHLAAALSKPNLTLYGPTNPELIGIYGKNQKILYSKTGNMNKLKPSKVWEAFIEMLNN